jgi:hypothetical protein
MLVVGWKDSDSLKLLFSHLLAGSKILKSIEVPSIEIVLSGFIRSALASSWQCCIDIVK